MSVSAAAIVRTDEQFQAIAEMANMALAEVGAPQTAWFNLAVRRVMLDPTPDAYRAALLAVRHLGLATDAVCLPCWLAQDATCGRVAIADAIQLVSCGRAS